MCLVCCFVDFLNGSDEMLIDFICLQDSKEATNPPAKKAKTTGASKSIFSFFQ